MELQLSSNSLTQPLLAQDRAITRKPRKSQPTESYHGKASPLSTGMLFGPTPRGIVDSIPHPDKPCLLFPDWCPIGECAHIALLEKEWEGYTATTGGDDAGFAAARTNDSSLFAVVHVCEALAKRGDKGSRLIKKLYGLKGDRVVPNTPVLVHENNVIIESCSSDVQSLGGTGLLGLLLPGHIDEAIGRRNSLRPVDAIGLYNMNFFIRRHSNLPYLVNELITSQSSTQRIKISTQLLNLLKTINMDLQKFDGPYLCGEQFTLSDICIFPYMERIILVLSHYRNFFLPPSLTHLGAWYETVSSRPSVQIATADRNEDSMSTYCYENIERKQYLLEVYECQIRGEMILFKELNAERGKAGVNVYREVMEEDDNDRRVCEVKTCHKLQQCVIC